MVKRKRTVVTVEIEQSLLVRSRPRPARVWCAACAAEVPAVSPEEAGSSDTAMAIRRWAEEGKVRFTEAPAGELRLCLPSLLACALVRPREI